MSGASLAGVARAAASRALERAVTSFAGHSGSDSSTDEPSDGSSSLMDCLVTKEDFEKAIEDVFDSAKGSSYEEDDAEDKDKDKSKGEKSRKK